MKENVNWYAVYTMPRAEKQVNFKLKANGFECFLPLHHSPRVWSDRVKLVDVPLFTSYVFVRCSITKIPTLIRIDGVVKVIYYNGKPAIIHQKEIDAIQQFLEKAEGRKLYTGEEVEIFTGSMRHISGKILKINKKYLLLHIEHLCATVCVNIENVVPLKRIR